MPRGSRNLCCHHAKGCTWPLVEAPHPGWDWKPHPPRPSTSNLDAKSTDQDNFAKGRKRPFRTYLGEKLLGEKSRCGLRVERVRLGRGFSGVVITLFWEV